MICPSLNDGLFERFRFSGVPSSHVGMAPHSRKRRTEDVGVVASHCERFSPSADLIRSRLPRDLRADAPPDFAHLLASGDGRHGSPEPSVSATTANAGSTRMAAGPGDPQQRRQKEGSESSEDMKRPSEIATTRAYCEDRRRMQDRDAAKDQAARGESNVSCGTSWVGQGSPA